MDKPNEIEALPELLADLVLEGRVFTRDALHTQQSTTHLLVEQGGDYVLLVKDNQPPVQMGMLPGSGGMVGAHGASCAVTSGMSSRCAKVTYPKL